MWTENCINCIRWEITTIWKNLVLVIAFSYFIRSDFSFFFPLFLKAISFRHGKRAIVINSRLPLLFASWRFPLFSNNISNNFQFTLLAVSAQLAIICVPALKLDQLNFTSTFDQLYDAHPLFRDIQNICIPSAIYNQGILLFQTFKN